MANKIGLVDNFYYDLYCEFYIGDTKAKIYLGDDLVYPIDDEIPNVEMGRSLSTSDIKKTPIKGLFIRKYGVVNIPVEGLFVFSKDISGAQTDYVVHINNYNGKNYVTAKNGATVPYIDNVVDNYNLYIFKEPIYFISHNLMTAYVGNAIGLIKIAEEIEE